jgi:formylglycine-generating enzyme required for sulfatase activity
MKFVYIPPGTFMMGQTESEKKLLIEHAGQETYDKYYARELPRHEVKLTKGFYMQTTQVTLRQWRAFAWETSFKTEAETGGGSYIWTGSEWEMKEGYYWDNPGFEQTDRHPVTCVSWNDVQAFINWLNKKESTDRYRLPTEAEWEYACRAGTETPFFFGDCLSADDQANYDGNYPMPGCPKGKYREKTVPVASFPPNAWGLYDMHGNVLEWVQDWYGDYPSGSVIDPSGPGSGSNRVLRGGSWYGYAWRCRSAYRDWYVPGGRGGNDGFRLALLPRSAGQ